MKTPQLADRRDGRPIVDNAYLRSLLETPGRILAEDAEHVVLALRLPNEVLREYVPLLMALADAAAAPSDKN